MSSPSVRALVLVTVLCSGCAPPAPAPASPACDARDVVRVQRGTVPVVFTSTHAGSSAEGVCGEPLRARVCTPELDLRCASGPCRASRSDSGAAAFAPAVVRAFTACMGALPSVVTLAVSRRYVDVNRDKQDPGGSACAYEDPASEAVWDAFYAALDDEIDHAQGRGAAPLVIDLHTYGVTPEAPPPAVILGSGNPVGLTLPTRVARAPDLPALFGAEGLARRLTDALAPAFAGFQVLPGRAHEDVGALFAGRHVLAHAVPLADALQVEISAVLRDEPVFVGGVLGRALCEMFLLAEDEP